MPKKTRKEKILSQQRKLIKKNTPVAAIPQINESIQEIPKITAAPAAQNVSPEEINIRKYFEKDLRKSLLIIGAIFALEIFFYFATINNYLDNYLNF